MGRIIAGLAAGVAVFVLVLVALELLAHQISPRPGSGTTFAVVSAGYFLSALAGGHVAARLSRRRWAAWAIAALVLAGAIWSLFQLGHPLWMQIASVAAPLLGGAAAARLSEAPAHKSKDAA